MHLDVRDLSAFYYRTNLGRTAQRALQGAVRKMWPDCHGLTVVGFGFATPMLRPYLAESERVMALMPGQQGVLHWPRDEDNVCALVEETRWPIEASSVDRLLVAHGLETCDSPDALLAEIWRVLAPNGRAIFVVPNRSGIWARRDATPFGVGRPYSAGQLDSILRKQRFVPEGHVAALYAPPSHRRFWLQASRVLERMGRRFNPQFLAGALLVEASKQVYARPPETGSKVSVPSPLEVLEGLAGPKPEHAARRESRPRK